MPDMRFYRWIALVLACMGNVGAQAPPPDLSNGLFAGEWAGIGERGTHCYLNLDVSGWGWVLIDGGTGDLMSAQVRWRNQRLSLHIDEIIPVAFSPRLRTSPLATLRLSSGFNRSLRLDWQSTGSCQMQRTDVSARQLAHARDVVQKLQAERGKP